MKYFQKNLEIPDLFLQIGKESSCVGSVHLSVVELKWECKVVAKESLFVSAPDDERIIENAAVHTYCAIKFCVDDCWSTDDHAAAW